MSLITSARLKATILMLIYGMPLLAFSWSLAVTNPAQPEPLPPPAPVGLEGVYKIEGKNAQGKPYTGMGQLGKRGEGYFVVWHLQGGRYQGLGVRQGNSLAMAQATDGFEVGCYRIILTKGIPTLQGQWTSWPGGRDVCAETWTWVALELPTPEEVPVPGVP